MTSDDGERVVRLIGGRGRSVNFPHGPVRRKSGTAHLEIITFVGTEESVVLHAAGDWMKEHPMTVIRAMNWRTDGFDAPVGRWALEIVVDHDAAYWP
ncbi:hypothetical protein [Streptomyces albireticuli]|uniref:Uncharacterized protein n=1 Tax=Streptomyces albireticuli TaxID=1940 RepID=A0A2A2DFY7_9ACTN|nr:hypothetical protein [Streptomyces albireticuli]MCD9146159.1 hypothetical protein [Streptomyces albireticuli]MCD9166210.1 hypothetical protein [Streptomyces albireticuli]MCD9196530.1 hypothetical protein [Streptomyces albireticuli]PAU50401.1 hypothetical protein CK936_02775 [Streptomyces albireticuli]